MTTVAAKLCGGLVVVASVYSILWVGQSLEARTAFQRDPVSVSSSVDRSNKADRLTPVAPAARPTVLVGCEPPFSSLAKVSSTKFDMRCLT
jgi:hypothetical protein